MKIEKPTSLRIEKISSLRIACKNSTSNLYGAGMVIDGNLNISSNKHNEAVFYMDRAEIKKMTNMLQELLDKNP